MVSSNAPRLTTTRLCSTATRRASIARCASNSATVIGDASSWRSPFSRIITFSARFYCTSTADRLWSHDARMSVDRTAVVAWYHRNRARSQALFDLLTPDAYYSQPIALRHPIVFYEGHLPGFSFNTLVKKALGRPSIDARLEALFARGIDPHENTAGQPSADGGHESRWPRRAEVHAFAAEADRHVLDVLAHDDLDRPGHPLLDHAEAVYAILEHEAM